MIALVLAAALFADSTPPNPIPVKAQAASETAPSGSNGPALSSVAVTLECTAFADGHVGACSVLGETHPGLGFGRAALSLMRDAVVPPGARDVRFARTIQFTP